VALTVEVEGEALGAPVDEEAGDWDGEVVGV